MSKSEDTKPIKYHSIEYYQKKIRSGEKVTEINIEGGKGFNSFEFMGLFKHVSEEQNLQTVNLKECELPPFIIIDICKLIEEQAGKKPIFNLNNRNIADSAAYAFAKTLKKDNENVPSKTAPTPKAADPRGSLSIPERNPRNPQASVLKPIMKDPAHLI